MDSNKNDLKNDCVVLTFPQIKNLTEKDTVRLKALVHRFTREFEREYLRALRAVNR